MGPVPNWIEWFFLAGVVVVCLVVPARFLWELGRERQSRAGDKSRLAERLSERYGSVEGRRGFFGGDEVCFRYRDTDVRLIREGRRRLRLHVKIQPASPLPVWIRTRRRLSLGPAWSALVAVQTRDPLVDEHLEVRASPVFADFLQDRFLDALTLSGTRSSVTESLVVLRRLPGLESMDLRFQPGRGIDADLHLAGEALLDRPEELESLLHHLIALNDQFANYDRPDEPDRRPSES